MTNYIPEYGVRLLFPRTLESTAQSLADYLLEFYLSFSGMTEQQAHEIIGSWCDIIHYRALSIFQEK
jgi:hypothetical protein